MRTGNKAVIFDLYHTLLWEDASNPFYGRVAVDLQVDHDRFMREYRSLGRASMSGHLKSMGDRVRIAALNAGYQGSAQLAFEIGERHMPAWLMSVKMYPDTRDTLEQLRAHGFLIGLASNASAYSDTVLTMTGLRRHFDAVAFSCHLGVMKPAPEIYQATAALLGADVADCYFVGDGGDEELKGASAAGMTTILIDRSLSHTEAAAAHAKLRAKSLSEAARLCCDSQP